MFLKSFLHKIEKKILFYFKKGLGFLVGFSCLVGFVVWFFLNNIAESHSTT